MHSEAIVQQVVVNREYVIEIHCFGARAVVGYLRPGVHSEDIAEVAKK